MNNKTILQEAFKKFELLEEETFPLNGSEEAVEDAKEFMDAGDALDVLDVIDPEAETEEDVEDSYTGKVILDCNVCHSKIYKDPEEIKVCEDEECVNKEEECPFCYSMDGFKIIGQVEPYEADPIYDITVEPKDDEEVEEDDDIVVEESFRKRSGKLLRESRKRRSRRLKEALGKKTVFIDVSGSNRGDDARLSLRHARTHFGKDADIYYFAQEVGKTPQGLGVGTNVRSVIQFIKGEGLRPEDVVVYTDEDITYGDDYLGNLYDYADTIINPTKFSPEITRNRKYNPLSNTDRGKELYKRSSRYHESLENIDLETGHDRIHIEAEEKPETDDEMLAPLEPEMEDQIEDAQELEDEIDEEDIDTEEPEEVDYDVEDFDEDTFDGLGESYLRKVYENVDSFKTTSVTEKGNKWIVEGRINFKSGNSKPTKFIFEAFSANRFGKLNFVGENAQISRGKKSFKLSGAIDNKKFFAESLNYNYRQKDSNGKSVRVYGTVRR